MANKELKAKVPPLDRDLDFNDMEFSFGDLPDDREPSSKPVKSFARGVRKGLGDTELIKNMMKKNLPQEYGNAFDMLDELASGSKKFADDSIKQAKPIIADLANAADKFLPSNFKTAKEKLNNIRSWAEKTPGSDLPNKDQMREQGIGIELGRIFQQQQKIDLINEKVDRRERALDRSLGLTQHRDVLNLLTKLVNSSHITASYITNTNAAWQNKTLENQYRTLFAVQDLLEETKKSNAAVLGNLQAITKNSALPDYQKAQGNEAFMDEARRKFSGRIIDASSNFFKRGLQKMRDDVGTAFSDLASMSSMLSLAGDLSAMDDELDPQSLKDKFAGMGGNKTGQWLLSKAGGKLVQMAKKNPKMVEKIVKGQNFLRALQNDGAGLSEEYLNRGKDKGGMLGALSEYLGNTFKLDSPTTALQKYDAASMYKSSPFTNKVAHSITDVIPGYLARILQQQTMMRTGQKAELVKFDFRSGKFDTVGNIVSSIKKSISVDELSGNSDAYFKDIMASIEEHTDLSPSERNEIARVLLKKGYEGSSLNPEKMTDTNHWADHVKDYSTAEKMAGAMRNIYGTESDKEFYSPNMNIRSKTGANDFVKRVKNLKTLRKDLYEQAQYLADNGMLDEAVAARLIKDGELNVDLIDRNTAQLSGSFKGKGRKQEDLEDTFANSSIDYDGHDDGLVQKGVDVISKRLRRKPEDPDRPMGTSDEDTKESIKKSGSVLGSISRLPIFSWQYKKGYEDNGATTNIGPMAQDLQKEFGDGVAPDGKKIDLVNASGIAMKAIQELNGKIKKSAGVVKDFFGTKGEEPGQAQAAPLTGLECLKGIYLNTSQMASQGSVMINLNAEGLRTLASGLGEQLGKIDLKGASKEVQKKYADSVKYVKENGAGSLLGMLGDAISNIGGRALGSGFKNGKAILSGGYKNAKELMGFVKSEAGDLLDKGKLAALETFDVMVRGENEPRMIALKIRQGHYVDFDTQMLVRTRKDIKSIKTGIVDTKDNNEFVLMASELPNTIFINKHKSAIERAIRSSGDFVITNAKAVLESYIKPGFGIMGDIASSIKNKAFKMMDNPIDIFAKDKLDTPLLLAKKMRHGYYVDFKSGDPIERPSQIKGAVLDIEKSELAVTQEEYVEGLVDIHNKPIDSAGGRFARNALGAAIGVGSSIMSWSLKKLTNMPGILGNMAKRGGQMLSKLGLPKFDIGGIFGKETTDILKDIRAILRHQAGLGGDPAELARAAGKGAVASGVRALTTGIARGFSVKAAANDTNVNALAANDTRYPVNQPQVVDGGNSLMKIASLGTSAISGAMSLFGKGKGAANDEKAEEPKQESRLERISRRFEELNKKWSKPKEAEKPKSGMAAVAANGAQYTEDGLRVGSWQERLKNSKNVNAAKDQEKAQVKTYATKNIFSMIADVVGGIKKKVSDWIGRKGDPAEIAEDIADGMGDGDKRQRRGRKGGRWGKIGSKLGGMARFGGKALGVAGAAYGAYSAYDNIKQGNYGSAALDAGLAVGSTALTVGGLSGTLGAIGTGLGVLATGAAAALTSPVVLAGAGIAAAGYGGYKFYKYLTRKKFNYTEVMRMLEYGLRGGDEEAMRKLYQLEKYVETCSSTKVDSWNLDEKKFDLKTALELFDIDQKDQRRLNGFVNWFTNRFKPVFGKWKMIAKQVGDAESIDWFEKANTAKLLDVFKAFTMSSAAYGVKDTPFASIAMNTNVSVITSFKDEWLMSLKNTAVKDKDVATMKAVAATGAAVVAARAEGSDEQSAAAKLTNVYNGNFTVNGQERSVNAAKAMFKAEGKFDDIAFTGQVTAFDAIKWRCYGLTILSIQRIKALRNLEAIVQDSVTINTNGKAVFDGDINDIMKKAAGFFGITADGSEDSKNWFMWFKNRFLPVYLTMHSGIFAFVKRNDVKNNYNFIEMAKASEKLTIARAMMGTPDIWQVKEFGFKNSPANSSAASCDENINFLESISKDEKAAEEKMSQKAPAPIIQPTKTSSGLDTLTKTKEPTSSSTPSSNTRINGAQSMNVAESEDKAYTDGASGSKPVAKTIASGSVGSLTAASGDLASGAGAMQFLKLADNANVNNLHPSVKRLFLGMVEEYGQKTGKSVQVNRGFSSSEEQAALFKKFGPGRAARPGTSLHEFGLALDVQSADLEEMEKLGLLRKYGFTRPLGSEPWHLEPAGIHDNAVRQKAKNDQGFATSYIESGVGRGGGGLGSRGRKGDLRRDDNYAKMVFEAASKVAEDKQDTPAPASPVKQMASEMTGKGSSGVSGPQATGQGLGAGLGDSEPANGKIPSASGSGNISTASAGKAASAANDETGRVSYELTSGVKGTVGGYASLPDSTGTGWTGNGLLIKEAAKMVGVDPGLAAAIAAKESSLNPSAQGKNGAAGNSVAQGMYQFMPGTWKEMVQRHGSRYGIKPGTSPLDAKANTVLGLEYIKASLKSGSGTSADAYLGHFLGASGAARFRTMNNADIPAKVFSSQAANNPNVFYVNGDKSKPRTKGEMINFINSSLQKQLADFNIPLSIATNKEAANDPEGSTASSSESGPIQSSLESTSKPAMQQASYTPPPTPARASRGPNTTSVSGLSEGAPVASRTRGASAPALENNNNGFARFEKVTNDQLVENRKTNELLTEIRDILKKTATAAPQAQQAALPAAQAPEANRPVPRDYSNMGRQQSELPQSFIQRSRRAA